MQSHVFKNKAWGSVLWLGNLIIYSYEFEEASMVVVTNQAEEDLQMLQLKQL